MTVTLPASPPAPTPVPAAPAARPTAPAAPTARTAHPAASAGRTTARTAAPYVHPAVGPFRELVADRPEWTIADLARLTRLLADGAQDALRFEAVHDPAERWYLRLALTGQVEVWLLTWTPGQTTRPHDHGGASGAYTVLDGELTETWRDGPVRARRAARGPGLGSAFGPQRVHRVANDGLADATSVHAYSPPLLPLGTEVELA